MPRSTEPSGAPWRGVSVDGPPEDGPAIDGAEGPTVGARLGRVAEEHEPVTSHRRHALHEDPGRITGITGGDEVPGPVPATAQDDHPVPFVQGRPHAVTFDANEGQHAGTRVALDT